MAHLMSGVVILGRRGRRGGLAQAQWIGQFQLETGQKGAKKSQSWGFGRELSDWQLGDLSDSLMVQ